MRIVAVLNQKGGVGKTTTAVNLGAALALRGRRVLLIDSDPQGNLTDHLGLAPGDDDATLYDVLMEGASIATATLTTDTEGLFVLPAEPDLAAAESELANEIGREIRLRRALAGIPADTYDWVFIDCPPSLGLLSVNVMAAATELLITLQTEYFALKGLAALDAVIAQVREHVNPQVELLGILPTLVNPVTLLAREVIDEVKTHYGDVVLGTQIRQNVSLAEAPSRGTHIFAYKPSSPGATDYLSLADEIEGRRDARARSHAARVASAERRAGAGSTPAQDAAPQVVETPKMPPPEVGRTPALDAEVPAEPEPTAPATPPATRTETPAVEPEIPESRTASVAAPGAPEPISEPAPVITATPEVAPPPAPVTPAPAPETQASDSGTSEAPTSETRQPEQDAPTQPASEPPRAGFTRSEHVATSGHASTAPRPGGPVPMAKDEARAWFRDAMARRGT